jgi:hypothetical protein
MPEAIGKGRRRLVKRAFRRAKAVSAAGTVWKAEVGVNPHVWEGRGGLEGPQVGSEAGTFRRAGGV